MKKRMMSVGLTVFLMLSVVPTTYAADITDRDIEGKEVKAQKIEFRDLDKTNWAYKAVNIMTEKNIIDGYDDGTFKPNNTVTYAEFIKMAVIADVIQDAKADGLEEMVKDVGDNTEGHWASNYYHEALNRGYFDRADIRYTQLDDEIPRGDMALVLSNIMGNKDIENYEALTDSLTDIMINTKNEYHIKKVYAEGVLSGYPDKTFRPEQTLNRAEAASVIYRLVDESARVIPSFEAEEQGEELIPEVEEEMYTVDAGMHYEVTAPIIKGKLGENGILDVKKAGIGVKNWKPYLKEGEDICITFSESILNTGDFRICLNKQTMGHSTLWINSKENSELNYLIIDGKYISTISPRIAEDLEVGEYPLILKYYPKEYPDNPCKFIEVTDVFIYNYGNGNLDIIKH